MKDTLNTHINEYRRHMQLGSVPSAYRGLMEYMLNLRTHFIHKYPDTFVTGSLYQGYMDITYFPFTPKKLRENKLKIGIVLNHKKVHFEIWLVGQNKQLQKKYWQLFKDNDWMRSSISATGQHAILESVLIENPSFDDMDNLTSMIEARSLKFINDVMTVFD